MLPPSTRTQAAIELLAAERERLLARAEVRRFKTDAARERLRHAELRYTAAEAWATTSRGAPLDPDAS